MAVLNLGKRVSMNYPLRGRLVAELLLENGCPFLDIADLQIKPGVKTGLNVMISQSYIHISDKTTATAG